MENGAKTIFQRFRASQRASGYRELAAHPLPKLEGEDRFVAAVKDLSSCLSQPSRKPACSGEDG